MQFLYIDKSGGDEHRGKDEHFVLGGIAAFEQSPITSVPRLIKSSRSSSLGRRRGILTLGRRQSGMGTASYGTQCRAQSESRCMGCFI
jgi:hypothetical protein